MRTVVAVLRGGPSSEYDASLKSGAAVLEHLDREKYEPRDVFITRKGEWHSHGMPMLPERALAGADMVFNALHGEFGEDGGVQRLLEVFKVPYTGSRTIPSALSFNKQRTKEALAGFGLKTPRSILVSQTPDVEEAALTIFRSFPQPSIVKPLVGGSSLGMTKVENFGGLVWGLSEAFKRAPKALVEEYIPGTDAAVGVIDAFRDEKVYATIPTPNTFSREEKERLIEAAKQAHHALDLSHYSQSDFIVSKRGIYFLETNALPKLHSESPFRRAVDAVGSTLSELLDHVISLAKKR